MNITYTHNHNVFQVTFSEPGHNNIPDIVVSIPAPYIAHYIKISGGNGAMSIAEYSTLFGSLITASGVFLNHVGQAMQRGQKSPHILKQAVTKTKAHFRGQVQ